MFRSAARVLAQSPTFQNPRIRRGLTIVRTRRVLREMLRERYSEESAQALQIEVERDVLVITTDSAALATALRLEAQKLLEILKAKARGLAGIRFLRVKKRV